jgi:hypothetical protein
LRRKGSIHSDVWCGTGADLATSGRIGVFPISGWWRFRKHLQRWGQQARKRQSRLMREHQHLGGPQIASIPIPIPRLPPFCDAKLSVVDCLVRSCLAAADSSALSPGWTWSVQ